MWIFLSLSTLSSFENLQAPFVPCQSAGFFLPAVVSLIIFGDQHDEDHDNQWQQLDFLKHLLWVYLMVDDFHRFFSLSLVITLPLDLVIVHIFRGWIPDSRKWNELTKAVQDKTDSSCPWLHVRELQRQWPHLLPSPPRVCTSAACSLLRHFVPLHVSRVTGWGRLACASFRTSASERVVANRNEDRACLSDAGFCLLCNYNACWKIIGESAWK